MHVRHDIPAELLRPAEAAAYLGMSRSRLWRLAEEDPTFPRKVTISARCVGYRRAALEEWLKTKEAGA